MSDTATTNYVIEHCTACEAHLPTVGVRLRQTTYTEGIYTRAAEGAGAGNWWARDLDALTPREASAPLVYCAACGALLWRVQVADLNIFEKE